VRTTRFLAAVLGTAMGLLPIVPPEHVHETEEQGHVHAVVHRHLTPHGIPDSHADHHPSVDDDDDQPVLTLKTIYNVPTAPVVLSPLPSIVTELGEPPAPKRIDQAFADVEILIHGPPRAPTPLRGPPSFPTA
jgi:hypothetical protein